MLRITFRTLLAIFALGTLAPAAQAEPRAPIVLAAASLQESLNAAADAFARQGHPRPVISFAATSALARQIEAGAPADLFFAADAEWMDYLASRKLIKPQTRADVLTNRLILIAPKSSSLRLTIAPHFPLAKALGAGRLAMADPDAVPAGRYGKAALTQLGVWPSVQTRITRSENVRAAMMLVSRGEVPLGVVYATDALAEPAVRVIGVFPPGSHSPIVYALAALTRSNNPEGEAFRRYLNSAAGKAIFRRFGFGTR
ncbi:MAG: molybdate ABC transporter substrate-binding protein [Novosphingobium sp.]